MVIGKIIYSKRVKEALEDIYHINPLAIIDSPLEDHYRAWVFELNDELSNALATISAQTKGDRRSNGNTIKQRREKALHK